MLKIPLISFIVFAGMFFGLYSNANAAPVNLILNPSVETAGTGGDPANWSRGGWGTNTRTFTYPAIGYIGAKAVKVEITNYTNGDAKWFFQDVLVTPGQTYTFNDNYNSNIPSFLSVRFKMTNGTYTYLDLPQIPSSAGVWKSEQRTFTIPTNVTSVTVFHVIKQVGYITTDNFSLTLDSLPPPPPTPVPSGNLIQNPTFETLGANGDPVGWFRGGYGNNTRSYSVIPCNPYYEDANLLLSLGGASELGSVFRPACPPNAKYRLSVHLSNYVDGNAKWYFAEVPISIEKRFRLSYNYQDYTRTNESQPTVRYTFSDGSYQYVPIGEKLRDYKPGGMGYVGWVYTENDFTAPAGAVSLTVFFSIQKNSLSGGLSIANPILRLRDGSELPAVSPDLTGPTTSITSPVAGATVSGTTTVTVNAADNVRVGAVRVWIDAVSGVTEGTPLALPDSTFPYSFEWNTTTVSDGPHTLSVIAIDAAGNIGTSLPVTITVANNATASPPSSGNLIQNPTFETLGANGDPVGWFRDGYGQNTRTYGVAPCPFFYTEDTPISWETVHAECPPNTKYKLGVHIGIDDYIDGEAKWYFADVPIGSNKDFRVAYKYQAYTYAAKAVVRYAFPNGTYSYFLLSNLLQGEGSMGYSGWVSKEHDFTAPTGATSLTIFFSVQGGGFCSFICSSADRGTLSIANPVLKIRNGSEPPIGGNGDTALPTVFIIAPITGQTVSGTMSFSVSASDNIGVVKVAHIVDSNFVGIAGFSSIPVTADSHISWDTTSRADGLHILTAQAIDAAGNIGTSLPVTITIANATSTPPPPPPAPTNLILNPSLETVGTGSDPVNWTRAGWGNNNRSFTYPVIGVEGEKAAKVEITSFTDGDAKWRFDDVPVTGGQTLNLTQSYRSNISTNITIRYTMSNGLFQYVGLENIVASPVWTTLNHTFVAPAGATSATAMNILHSVGWLEVDAFSLTSNTP